MVTYMTAFRSYLRPFQMWEKAYERTIFYVVVIVKKFTNGMNIE